MNDYDVIFLISFFLSLFLSVLFSLVKLLSRIKSLTFHDILNNAYFFCSYSIFIIGIQSYESSSLKNYMENNFLLDKLDVIFYTRQLVSAVICFFLWKFAKKYLKLIFCFFMILIAFSFLLRSTNVFLNFVVSGIMISIVSPVYIILFCSIKVNMLKNKIFKNDKIEQEDISRYIYSLFSFYQVKLFLDIILSLIISSGSTILKSTYHIENKKFDYFITIFILFLIIPFLFLYQKIQQPSSSNYFISSSFSFYKMIQKMFTNLKDLPLCLYFSFNTLFDVFFTLVQTNTSNVFIKTPFKSSNTMVNCMFALSVLHGTYLIDFFIHLLPFRIWLILCTILIEIALYLIKLNSFSFYHTFFGMYVIGICSGILSPLLMYIKTHLYPNMLRITMLMIGKSFSILIIIIINIFSSTSLSLTMEILLVIILILNTLAILLWLNE